MTIYAVNFLWILSTGIGLALAVYGARESWLDKQALLKLKKNGDKWVLASGAFVAQMALTVGQGAFLAVGLSTLAGPLPANPFTIVAGLLLLGSWCMTTASGIAIYVNRKVQVSVGTAGPPGPRGKTGATGKTGKTGKTGRRGKSG
jgi:hypothetical protein